MTPPKWYNSLRVQIVLLLTLALLPLGAVAIYQTNRVETQAARNAELALLALTRSAAKEEELFIQRALGVARFFGTVAADFIEEPDRCLSELQKFVADNSSYSFIGILPLSGLMTCTSTNEIYDATSGPYFAELMETKTRDIVVFRDGPLSGESIFNVNEPFEIDGEFGGFISISIPHRGMPETTQELEDLGLVELMTINANDDILTARNDLNDAILELPFDRSLASLKAEPNIAFPGLNQRGERRVFTVVPIEGSPATVIGVWRADESRGGRLGTYIQPAVFPILMWFASMAVAMLSIYTLVLRHIARLRRNMDAFADRRSIETTKQPVAMPNELQALASNFDRMTDDIVREEAQLEDVLREKNVLIKEVHHRVKNNLQLISSIMNMQIRTAQQDETKAVLRRLQDRVLSLATIHRDLYQSQHGGMVDVGALVAEIVDKTVEFAVSDDNHITVKTDIDRVLLYPDQAVPLSLLVSEGVTNAMKYLGVADGAEPFIGVSLKQIETECVLTLSNSIGDAADVESTGLGAQLINAFTIQLCGQITLDETAGAYTMTLRFQVEEFAPVAQDF